MPLAGGSVSMRACTLKSFLGNFSRCGDERPAAVKPMAWEARGGCAGQSAFSRNFCTLPVALRGRAFSQLMRLGTL